MKLLALDQAPRSTGYAIYSDRAYHTGTIKSPAGSGEGERLLQLMRALNKLHTAYGFNRVAYEKLVFRGAGERPIALRTLHHVEAIVLLFCENKKIPEPTALTPDEWRKAVFGKGMIRAPKSVKAAQRKAWHHDHAFMLCKSLGLNIKDGDEAEAVGILEAFRGHLKTLAM